MSPVFVPLASMIGYFSEKDWREGRQPTLNIVFIKSMHSNYPRQMPASPIPQFGLICLILKIPKRGGGMRKAQTQWFLEVLFYPGFWQNSNAWFERYIPGTTYSWLLIKDFFFSCHSCSDIFREQKSLVVKGIQALEFRQCYGQKSGYHLPTL